MKKADPAHEVTCLERNAADDTFGWGVVFSDQTLGQLPGRRPARRYEAITDNFAHWDDIDIHCRGATITSGGHGFAGIARADAARDPRSAAPPSSASTSAFGARCATIRPRAPELGDADLHRRGRRRQQRHPAALRRATSSPTLDVRTRKYIWLGTTRLFDAFTFVFVENEHGVFQAHAYRFDDTHSAFIVECDEASWRNAGFDRMDVDETIAACEAMFAPWLDGHRLLANNASHLRGSPWLNFPCACNATWCHDNVVLIGDAAHTAHFSIGSGTKLAMEDAIALAARAQRPRRRSGDGARSAYQDERGTEALRLQNAARNSMEWFENVRRYIGLDRRSSSPTACSRAASA